MTDPATGCGTCHDERWVERVPCTCHVPMLEGAGQHAAGCPVEIVPCPDCAPTPAGETEPPFVKIEWDPRSSEYVISDEGGEFARCSELETGGDRWRNVFSYVADLLGGHGTQAPGDLRERTKASAPPSKERTG